MKWLYETYGGDYAACAIRRAIHAERRLSLLKTCGMAELMIHNPNAKSYAEHWEARTEKAEAEAGAAKEHATNIIRWLDPTRDDAKSPTSNVYAGIQEAKAILDGSSGRSLADFLARLRAKPCEFVLSHNQGFTSCPAHFGKERINEWCWPCQSRSPNYGGPS